MSIACVHQDLRSSILIPSLRASAPYQLLSQPAVFPFACKKVLDLGNGSSTQQHLLECPGCCRQGFMAKVEISKIKR